MATVTRWNRYENIADAIRQRRGDQSSVANWFDAASEINLELR